MSILTIAVLILIAVVVLGLVVVIVEEYGARFGHVETYRISTHELPNIALDIWATDRDTARR